ncbi:MAG: endonuclease/exonuclease/phosphatase family protein, partial [Bacillota bacterium]
LKAIVGSLRQAKTPVILVGDFNAPPGAPEQAQVSALLKDSRDASDKVSGDGTFGMGAGQPGERIDFIWLSTGLKALSWTAIPSQASDHLPVVVEVAPEGAPAR